jgi:hypothetical protein
VNFFFKSSDTIKTVIERLLSKTDVGIYTTYDKLLLFSSSDLRESQPIQNDKKLEEIDTKLSITLGKKQKNIQIYQVFFHRSRFGANTANNYCALALE